MSIAGKQILLVEDEVLVAMGLEDMVQQLGATVVGSAYDLKSGLQMAEACGADCAVLDFNLNGENSLEIAMRLAARGIPFVLATGYGVSVNNQFDAPILEKPYLLADLERALVAAMDAK